jgi:uncharacterized protein YggE
MSRLLAVVALAILVAGPAAAEDRNTITVRGKGTVRVRPDRLILVLGASGKAEKATDAAEKLARKRAEIGDAIKKALEGKQGLVANVKDNGLTFGGGTDPMAQIRMLGGQQQEGAGETAVATELEITVEGIDKMADADLASLISGLMDKTADAGAEIEAPTNRYNPFLGSGSGRQGVFFGFSNYEAQVEKAWDEAAKKARERAGAIASRLGMTVGDAVSVKDMTNQENPAAKAANPYLAMLGMVTGDEGPKIKSSGEMELAVEMEVEFELKKK